MRAKLIALSIHLYKTNSWEVVVKRYENGSYIPFLYMEEDDFLDNWDTITSIEDNYIVMDRNGTIREEIKKGTLWAI